MNSTQFKLSKATLAIALAALAGCAVGPDYVAPKTDLAPFHNTANVAAAGARAVPALDQWWLGFDDPLLVKIVQRALDQNLDLEASLARVRQARAAASGAGAELLPSIDLGGSAVAEHQSLQGPIGSITRGSPAFRRNIQDYSVGPAASWEIDLFGGNRRASQAARLEAQAAEADAAGTRVSVAADAADAYFQIRGYQARLAIAQRQISIEEDLLRIVRDRYAAGAAQGREIAQADALVKQARAVAPPLQIGLELQLNRLDVLMGAQPGTYAKELATVQDIPSLPAVPGDDAPREVLRNRPDVIAAEHRLAASNERIGVAVSGYYPKISLSGALGFDSLGGSRLFTSNAFQASGGVGLRWRLFDFGRVDAEIAQAKGANEEALAAYRLSVLRAAEDVENAFVVLSQTQLHVIQLQDEVKSLVRARELSEQAYRSGTVSLTEVLDADRELLAARDELDANRAGAARAAVAVFRALGGGWESKPSVQTAKN